MPTNWLSVQPKTKLPGRFMGDWLILTTSPAQLLLRDLMSSLRSLLLIYCPRYVRLQAACQNSARKLSSTNAVNSSHKNMLFSSMRSKLTISSKPLPKTWETNSSRRLLKALPTMSRIWRFTKPFPRSCTALSSSKCSRTSTRNRSLSGTILRTKSSRSSSWSSSLKATLNGLSN